MQRWLRRLRPGGAATPAAPATPATTALAFTEVEGVLALYVTALSGGALRVMANAGAARGAYTDGRTIFLPPQIDLFPDPADARRLYRVMTAWGVLQATTGYLNAAAGALVDHPGAALALYEALAGEWLDRRLVATWPGLAADLTRLRADALARRDGVEAMTLPEALLRALLTAPLARPLDAAALVEAAARAGLDAATAARLAAVPEALAAPDPAACRALALGLARAVSSPPGAPAPAPVPYRARLRPELLRRPAVAVASEETTATADDRDRQPKPPRATPRGLPIHVEARTPEQLVPRERRPSAGGRQAVQLSIGDREPPVTFQQVPLTAEEKAGAELFDEWDYLRRMYLPEWCAVRLRRPRGGSTEPVERILRQHRPLVTRLKQQFEALRPERLRLTRQLDGDELDLTAIVEDHADRRAGAAPAEKLYSRTLERERNIALGCLVDLSGSTGAWIDDDPRNDQVIEVTRRALVFLCEALTVLDDRYAIFGFTGGTRKRCEITVVKAFDERYGETVKGRIAGLAPGAYTRIGPAVRYTTRALLQQPARVRLLLLISDGRPNDFDGYGGRYGIEDTRRALIEARQQGVATFALTIDAEARDYMPYMFGRSHYVVVEDTPALAVRLADVYRRLTTQ
ncbi:MAG: hypothetical protein QJR03_14630 [Sphaerobacter sp.]|nr:hypothetical protein [Sphaerobacter sp.]